MQLSHFGVIRNVMYAHHYATSTTGYEGTPTQAFALIELDGGPKLEGEIANLSPAFIKKDLLGKAEQELRAALVGKKVRAVLRRYRKLDN